MVTVNHDKNLSALIRCLAALEGKLVDYDQAIILEKSRQSLENTRRFKRDPSNPLSQLNFTYLSQFLTTLIYRYDDLSKEVQLTKARIQGITLGDYEDGVKCVLGNGGDNDTSDTRVVNAIQEEQVMYYEERVLYFQKILQRLQTSIVKIDAKVAKFKSELSILPTSLRPKNSGDDG